MHIKLKYHIAICISQQSTHFFNFVNHNLSNNIKQPIFCTIHTTRRIGKASFDVADLLNTFIPCVLSKSMYVYLIEAIKEISGIKSGTILGMSRILVF